MLNPRKQDFSTSLKALCTMIRSHLTGLNRMNRPLLPQLPLARFSSMRAMQNPNTRRANRLRCSLSLAVRPVCSHIGVIFQQELRLFEVQLLYAISEQLAGKSTTVAEVVAWWFPASKQVQARETLQTIGDAMRVAGVSVVSADWVRDYFRATFSRVRRKAEPAAQKNLENDYAEPVSAMVH